jgi:hypothetical protein
MVDNRYDLGWLVGRTLAEVNWTEQGSWQFGFGPDAGVRADCPWRVIRDGGIALSSEDHGHQYGLPAPVDAEAECRRLIGGAVVAAAEVRDETAIWSFGSRQGRGSNWFRCRPGTRAGSWVAPAEALWLRRGAESWPSGTR